MFFRSLQKSKPVKAAFWFTLCNIITKGIQFFVVPVYVRLLTTAQYGMYAIYTSWFSIVSIIATLNLGSGVFNNGMLNYEHDRDSYISAMQGLSTTVTLALCIISIVFLDKVQRVFNLPAFLVIFMFVQCLFSPSLIFWYTRQRFEYKYQIPAAVTLSMALIMPLCGIMAVTHSVHKGEAIIIGTIGADLLFGVFFYVYNFVKGKKFFDRAYWSFALKFNIPLIPHYLSTIVMGQADRIMIDRFVGREKAGIYSLIYALSLAMNIIIGGVNSSFIPWTYQSIKEKNYNKLLKTANTLVLLFAGVLLLFIIVAPELLRIIATPDYYEAVWVIPPIAMSTFLGFVYSLFGMVLFYFSATKFVMISSITGAVGNVILNYLFIIKYGYLAAGWTTLASSLIITLLYYLFMRLVCQKHIPAVKLYDLKFIIFVTLCLILFSVISMLLYNNLLVRYVIVSFAALLVLLKRKAIMSVIGSIRR